MATGEVLVDTTKLADGRTDSQPEGRRIEASELIYFKKVSEGLQRANQLEAEAANLDRQAAGLRQQAIALTGAHDSWVSYLVERYKLDPVNDQIDPESGLIQRSAGAAP